MKIRGRTFPALFLLLAPALCESATDDKRSLDLRNVRGRDVAKGAPPVAAAKAAPSIKPTKSDVGTKDAPVDGYDGKPHEGPFVEPWKEQVSKSPSDGVKSGDKTKLVPEDGVMNDPNRTPPKKGTTGTEGGVTEKERERKVEESSTGQTKPKTPSPPKEAPPPPNGNGEKPPASNQGAGREKTSNADKLGSGKEEKPKGAPGMERPADLPPTPHDKPPNVETPPKQEKNPFAFDPTRTHVFDKQKPPPVHKVVEEELAHHDEYEDEDGVHDFIPWDSLAGSFSSIAATEIGDKTFIVAALMAMRHPRIQVFTAAFSALFIMTILSGVAGHAVGTIVSKRWAALLAALLFLVFGVKSIREGLEMHPNQGVSEEMREVQAELEEKEVDMARMANGHKMSTISPYELEAGRAARPRSRSRLAPPRRSPSSSRSPSPHPHSVQKVVLGFKNLLSLVLSPAWVETFSMTFIGELGDRSQIATVAMAAGQEYYWVMVGASLGHFVCTAVAVLGGSVLAGRVSMRKVTLTGGGIFIGFGLFTLFEAIQYWRS